MDLMVFFMCVLGMGMGFEYDHFYGIGFCFMVPDQLLVHHQIVDHFYPGVSSKLLLTINYLVHGFVK